MPNDRIGKSLPNTEHVMYLQGNRVEPDQAIGILDTIMPYFSRTWEHFCSHRHTPSSSQLGTPAAIKTDATIYFSHPIFTIYDKLHPKWCKEIVKDALKQFLQNQIVETDGPTTMVATLNEQEAENRYVLHALHYVPIKNSQELYTIEDVIPLHDITFSLQVQEKVTSVTLVPEGKNLEYSIKNSRIEFTIPRIEGHAMVALQY
jgi:hypothetical protein